MYTLIIEDRHGRSAAEISFDQGSYTIGRVDGNDVVLPSNSVSRTHARIFVSNNKCYVDDLGSANGVHVNGTKIQARTEIKNGYKIRIGEYTLYLEYKDQNDMSNAGQDVLKTQIVSGGQSGYKIVRVADQFAGEEFMLSEASNTIGRTEENYILLSDSSISRNHAKIINQNLNYSVIDLGSSNGTFVNNKLIKSESPLKSGDLIRFGNVTFVFVPATQHVDLVAYANAGKKSNDNRTIFTLFLALFIILVIGFAIVLFALNSESPSEPVAETPSAADLFAKKQARLDEATRYYNNALYEEANKIVRSLNSEFPNEENIQSLQRKIEIEIECQAKIKQASDHILDRHYNGAIDLLETIGDNTHSFDEAQKLIKEAKSKIRLARYNDARSKCDEGLSVESVEELCEAAKTLQPTGIELDRIESTIQFMDRISEKKSKYSATAKKCAKLLKDLL